MLQYLTPSPLNTCLGTRSICKVFGALGEWVEERRLPLQHASVSACINKHHCAQMFENASTQQRKA